MASRLSSILIGRVGLAIVPIMATFSLRSTSIFAQPPLHLAQRSPEIVFVRRETSGSSPGGRYRGGGSRSLCQDTALPLTALVPFEEKYISGNEKLPASVDVWGFTTIARPTFWVYTPYDNLAVPAKFSIEEDETGNILYETAITLPKQAGIMGIRLPESAPALQPGKRYRWIFSVSCRSPGGTIASMGKVYVEAVVMRELPQPELTSKLSSTASLPTAIAYAQAGFWYDALTTLAELRQQRPQDVTLQTAWKELLAGVATTDKARQNFNLEQISSQPLMK